MMRRRLPCWLCLVLALGLVSAGTPPAIAGCYDRDDAGQQTRFRVSGGVVEDIKTGLIWQRCTFGTQWDDKEGCVGEVATVTLDQALAAEADGWRVPSGPQLETIVDIDCGSPVVDRAVFDDISPDEEGHAKYWTTTPMGMLDLYWNFDFTDGQADANSRGIQLAVRFVRAKR
ncbi:DUF1566 domain-containing protein [Bradyrhizobium sp. HKCCYLS2038]|uniref:Lcl C-terminal domain-containing protein n=1 Tax=unclassified Bradyrhizobium TaxID=2631580 RepID=UPI003EB7627D